MDLVDDLAVVVEGPVDALKGGDGFIASFGVDLTDEQLCVLLRYEKVIFLRDNDAGGNKTVEMAYKLSSLGHDDVELVAAGTEYKDIGEMPDDAILDLRKGLGL